MSLFKLFGAEGSSPESEASDTDAIRRIVSKINDMEPARARHIAAFAFILSRVANADRNISDEEVREMERIVMDWGGLPEEQAVLVVQIARNQNILFGGTDNFIVTREFAKSASRQEKIELMNCLFAVSAADNSISVVEETSIAEISRELGFSHREMIAIRSQYSDKRAVLRKED